SGAPSPKTRLAQPVAREQCGHVAAWRAAISPRRAARSARSPGARRLDSGSDAARAGAAADGIVTGFSAALAPEATDFVRLSADGLAAVWGAGQRVARTDAELVRDVNLGRVGAELFGWVILLAAAAMAGDWIVANRFYAPREEDVVGAGPAAEVAAAASRPAEQSRRRRAQSAPEPLDDAELVGEEAEA
ncbi:MAG: hypothetical protein ACKOTB_13375, partial [Planctomycetia bacterium]